MMESIKQKWYRSSYVLILCLTLMVALQSCDTEPNCVVSKFKNAFSAEDLHDRVIVIDIIRGVDESHNALMLTLTSESQIYKRGIHKTTFFEGTKVILRNFTIASGEMEEVQSDEIPKFLNSIAWGSVAESDVSTPNQGTAIILESPVWTLIYDPTSRDVLEKVCQNLGQPQGLDDPLQPQH